MATPASGSEVVDNIRRDDNYGCARALETACLHDAWRSSTRPTEAWLDWVEHVPSLHHAVQRCEARIREGVTHIARSADVAAVLSVKAGGAPTHVNVWSALRAASAAGKHVSESVDAAQLRLTVPPIVRAMNAQELTALHAALQAVQIESWVTDGATLAALSHRVGDDPLHAVFADRIPIL